MKLENEKLTRIIEDKSYSMKESEELLDHANAKIEELTHEINELKKFLLVIEEY